jgi:hypothetical protein
MRFICKAHLTGTIWEFASTRLELSQPGARIIVPRDIQLVVTHHEQHAVMGICVLKCYVNSLVLGSGEVNLSIDS